jgi:SpoIID/LytB domain protein
MIRENRSLNFFLILSAFTLLLSINSHCNAALDLFEEARVFYNQAEFEQAIGIYQKIIEDNPEEFAAYLNLAYLYKDLAEYKPATEVIKKALKSFKDSRLQILLGRLYYLEGKAGEALFQLKQLLPSHSEDPQVLFYLGQCYEESGEFDQAQAFYLDVVRAKPDNVLAYLKLGNIYYGKQMFKEASQSYQRVISLDPSLLEVRPRLAECLGRLGEFQEAYKQYAKCVAIYPEDKLLQKGLEETKIKLGEDFLKQRETEVLQRRRKKSIQVRASCIAEEAPQVRVGIAKTEGSIEFKAGSLFQLIDKQSGESLFRGRKELVYSLAFDKKARQVRNKISKGTGIQLRDSQGNVLMADLDKPFIIKNNSKNSVVTIFDLSLGVGNVWAGWQDQHYRGIIEVIPEENSFQLINQVNLEEYLYGVLSSEMPAAWPGQALRTQAIAARTWAVRNLARHNHQGFNFCNTVHCQVYKGAGSETPLTNQAVEETAGIILVRKKSQSDDLDSDTKGRAIDIFYSNNCGGCTRDGILDALSLDFHFPLSPLELEDWLRTEPDTFCNLKDQRKANFRWARCYRKEQLQAILGRAGIDIGALLKIIPQRRTRSGHLTTIKIKGTKNSKIIEGENYIRKILGNLRSSAFKIEVKYNRSTPVEFIFYGAGFGHGRGLCQAGIKGMALKGYNYRQILRHYYPDAEVKKMY